jgi:hypothetical protein
VVVLQRVSQAVAVAEKEVFGEVHTQQQLAVPAAEKHTCSEQLLVKVYLRDLPAKHENPRPSCCTVEAKHNCKMVAQQTLNYSNHAVGALLLLLLLLWQ